MFMERLLKCIKRKNSMERVRCEIWSRVMGYYRPVSFYNKGKKSEFKDRKSFKEVINANKDFSEKYQDVQ